MNESDENQRTPLMYAVSLGWSHVVEFLLERGVDSGLVDDRHTTALMQACSLGLPTIVRLILDSGAGVDDVCLVSTSAVLSCSYYRASYASTILAVIVCLSVCPSVCLSQVGVVQRWLNLGSH